MDSKWSIAKILMSAVVFVFLNACNTDKTEKTHELQVEEGLKVTLVAEEPMVIDPVAFSFDENGFLYVVEDRGYPDPPEGGKPDKKEGPIVRLEDIDLRNPTGTRHVVTGNTSVNQLCSDVDYNNDKERKALV